MPVIILAMHGAPPSDFPPNETIELFNLYARLELANDQESQEMQERYNYLDTKMRDWPRTPENDPFYAGSVEIADHLREATRQEVILGFNEFCSPSLDEAFERALTQSPKKIIVITPMMTRGGEHSEVDIPTAVERVKAKYPEIVFVYIWPFDPADVAQFLAAQIDKFNSQ